MEPIDRSAEHFVTLFDNNFLPMGMAIHRSLMQHAQPFHLWIVCMDELVEKNLTTLSLPNVSLLPVCEIESKELKKVKTERTGGEYCWTVTPFTPQAVFDRNESVERVTYLDADLFFFDTPQILLEEFKESGKHVLITDHAYAPEYDQSATCGRFCVQFMTFRKTPEAQKVMKWWQDRCLEWCYNRIEDGKFGDQKYLDNWPRIFPDEVHVFEQTDRTLAPWNEIYFEKRCEKLNPVFYHFHNLRIVSPNIINLYTGYKIGTNGIDLYKNYVRVIKSIKLLLTGHNISLPFIPQKKEKWFILRVIKRKILRITRYATL